MSPHKKNHRILGSIIFVIGFYLSQNLSAVATDANINCSQLPNSQVGYYLDRDPPPGGAGIATIISGATNVGNMPTCGSSITINLGTLSAGAHTIHVFFIVKNGDNISLFGYQTSTFLVAANPVSGSGGGGGGVSISISPTTIAPGGTLSSISVSLNSPFSFNSCTVYENNSPTIYSDIRTTTTITPSTPFFGKFLDMFTYGSDRTFQAKCLGSNGGPGSPFESNIVTLRVVNNDCSAPWGGQVSPGSSVTAFQSSSVPFGSTCSSETRTCSNGSLSGSFTNQNCSVQPPVDCNGTPFGNISHGNSVTAFQSPSVYANDVCSSETRTCSNGSLSGTYTNAGCSVIPPPKITSASVSPTTIPFGGNFTSMSYTSENATGCTVDGVDAGTGLNFTWGVNGPYETTTSWTFRCFNPNGLSDSKTVTLNVLPPPRVTVSNDPAPPTYISYGGNMTSMSYSSTNTVRCEKYDDGIRDTAWPESLTSNTWGITGPYFADKTWTFKCYNEVGRFDTKSVTLKVCPKGYKTTGTSCVNPAPTISISPIGPILIPINQPFTFRSSAGDDSVTSFDADTDMVAYNLEWQKPDGKFNWEPTSAPDGKGTVTYSGTTTFSPKGTADMQATLTPNTEGYYKVRFAVQDNTLSHFSGTDRWTYSPFTTVAVVRGVGALIYTNPTDSSKLKWECFNATKATLVTTPDASSNDFLDRTVPPNSGIISPTNGTTYTITCENSRTGERKTFSYSLPTISTSNIGPTNATVTWDCKSSEARNVTIERSPGGSSDFTEVSESKTDSDLRPNTEYSYTLRCFDSKNAQIGTKSVRLTTQFAAAAQNLTIKAFVKGVSSDSGSYSSTQPLFATTRDNQFDSWSYRVEGDATACVMDQRNDNGEFFPVPAYDTDPKEFTFSFNSNLNQIEKTDFVSSFTTQHDWRLTCTDAENKKKSLIWSIVKSNNSPAVIDASLNLNCAEGNPTLSVQCANSDYYEVKKTGETTPISSGNTTRATVQLNSPGLYKVVCKMGGSSGTASREVFRTYTASMCSSRTASFTASPYSIRSGGVTTLLWDITQPTPACTITATPVCAGSCSDDKYVDNRADADQINHRFETETTDANDPNFVADDRPRRTVAESIKEETFNNGVRGHSLGKKTIRLKYTTDISINCPDASQKVRIKVSNENIN